MSLSRVNPGLPSAQTRRRRSPQTNIRRAINVPTMVSELPMPPPPPRSPLKSRRTKRPKMRTRSRSVKQTSQSPKRKRTPTPSPRRLSRRRNNTRRSHSPHRRRAQATRRNRSWMDKLWDWIPFVEKEKAVYPGSPRRAKPRRNLSTYRRADRQRRRQ